MMFCCLVKSILDMFPISVEAKCNRDYVWVVNKLILMF
jgi:hypothetical protein